MKACHNAVLFGLLLAAIVLVPRPLAAGRPPEPGRIDALVRDLGSAKFSVREKASRQLIDLGIVTRDALARATRHDDAEVRARARTILATVYESDFQDRLAAFSADYDGRLKQTLPSWDQFSAQFGANRFSRQLFVEMQRAEPDLLAALAAGPKSASTALTERFELLISSGGNSLSTLGTQASLLFVAASEGVDVSQIGSLNIFPFIVQSVYQRNRRSPLWSDLLRKLVGGWLAKENTPAAATRNLVVATQYELKDESLTIAMHLLSNADSPANSRQMAILIVGRYGGQPQRAVLEELLDDATSCGMAQTENEAERVELQIRDVALASLLYMTGQDLRDYGFASDQPFGRSAIQPGTIGLADAKTREAALAKWAKWRADHPDS